MAAVFGHMTGFLHDLRHAVWLCWRAPDTVAGDGRAHLGHAQSIGAHIRFAAGAPSLEVIGVVSIVGGSAA